MIETLPMPLVLISFLSVNTTDAADVRREYTLTKT